MTKIEYIARYGEDAYKKHLEYSKQHYQNNKEKRIEQMKEYRELNPDIYKQWYKENKEKLLEYQKQYKKENKEKVLEYYKQYYKDNKEKLIEYQKQYKTETQNGKAKHLLQKYKRRDEETNKGECTLTSDWIVNNIFNSTCVFCGESDWHKLGCDRIDNSKPHSPNNVQCCCYECNVKKHTYTNEEYINKIKPTSN